MKSRFLICLTSRLITLLGLLLPLMSWAAPPGTIVGGDYIDVTKQTWIEYDQPIKDPLGNAKYPWQPKGEYPWEQPYTGTELMYLADDHFVYGAKYQNYSLISARLNKRGLMVQRKAYVARETMYDHYRDVLDFDGGKVKLHDIRAKFLLIYETPADVRGTGAAYHIRHNGPQGRWVIDDKWIYSPGLRRVTRSQGGDRQDELFGTPVTNDDNGERKVWEEEHLLIGEDVLYESLLDPQFIAPERAINTGDLKKDGEFFKKNADRSRGEEPLSPYRPDGGVECWVVLSKWAKRTKQPPFGSHVYPDPKLYYLKYRITWIEKVTKFPVRQEQYDHDNRLIKFLNFVPEFYGGDFVKTGLNRTQYMCYDLRRHFVSWGSYDRAELGPEHKVPTDWYTPEFLFKEYFWKSVKVPMYKSPKQFAPCPPLYRSKFPKYRAGTQDWLTKKDMEILAKKWKNHGFSDEEIEAYQYGDGVLRKNGKLIPVRKHVRPAFIHGKPFPVKFPNE